MKEERKQEGSSVRLKDRKFPWKAKKGKANKLAQIFDAAGYKEYGDRVSACSGWLLYRATASDETKRDLKSANFCQLRLCPVCAGRRAKKMSYKLSKILNYVEATYGCQFIFLTLTVRNCEGKDLGDTIDLLTDGWHRLVVHRDFKRAVHGWFRAIEVTRNKKDGTYHPHIHAVLAVLPEYKEGSPVYIDQLSWRKHWQVAAALDYDPSVRISRTRGKKKGKGTDTPSESASKEAAKYVTKDSEYIDPRLSLEEAAEIVAVYTEALRGRRLVAFGGWLKDAAKKFKAGDMEFSTDLVHLDEDSVRDDLLELIERYEWNFGVGDYILTSREVDPECVDPKTGELKAPSGPEKQEVLEDEKI